MTGIRRVGMAARLVGEKREEYLELHRNVWPEVEAMITECNIRNFTIFALEDYILGYYEYVGDDFDADAAKLAADPISQRWWTFTAPCQLPLREDSSAPNWESFQEIWHLE
ncbi:L-rhamnose mutarotase [Microbacteriaceae bacterium VKM Ac-2855]|nr:L-rhamnose mutarotase [Microbacteriaceae bacterium VKM Ac-2855]